MVEAGGDESFVPDIVTTDGGRDRRRRLDRRGRPTPATLEPSVLSPEGENALFSGDHVMGWSTTIVSPPDGDMANYVASLDKLIARGEMGDDASTGRPTARRSAIPAPSFRRSGRTGWPRGAVLACLGMV